MRIARTMVRSVLPCILTVALFLGVISPAANALAATASLSVPTNVTWMDGSTATATWDAVDGANYYNVKVSAYSSGTLIGTQYTGTAGCAIDVQDIIKSINGIANYQTIDTSFRIQAVYLNNSSVLVTSDWSSDSDLRPYSLQSGSPYATPTGVTFNEATLTVSWNVVPGAEFYDVYYYIPNSMYDWDDWYGNSPYSFYEENGVLKSWSDDITISNGVITADVSRDLAQWAVLQDKVGQGLQLYCMVKVVSQDPENHTDSAWSSKSGIINYRNDVEPYATPTGVTFNEAALTVSWNVVPGAEYYDVYYYIPNSMYDWDDWYGNSPYSFYEENGVLKSWSDDITISNGVITADVSRDLAQWAVLQDKVGQDLQLYCMVKVVSQDPENHTDSAWSSKSNTIKYCYKLGKTVEKVNITPKDPYVPVGLSYTLGKTIEPIDAYYSSVNWSSNDNSIVTVDSYGKLTGVSEGTATVTATIDAASDAATVTVYKLETNVNEKSEEDVLNYTNSVINNIVEGDAAGTDITNVTNAATLIEAGMDNEDEFHIDIEQETSTQDYSSAGWNNIESLYSGDPEYGGAVDVSLELYSEDDAGKETSIGNITEFDNEIQFEIDIPAGLPAVEPGYTREYSVVRVHDGQYTVLDCTLNEDYTLTVESDKFSDYVIVYNDTLTGTYPIDSAEMLPSGVAHVQDIGDVAYSVDMESGILTIGTRGMGKRLEEITINFVNTTPYEGSLEYRVHVQDIGWMDWVPAGTKCGTEGMSKRIEAIEIRLTGDLANYYSVEYCVHIQDYGDMQGWVKDGALAGTTGESKRIEELKIRIVPIGSGDTMSVKYRVHVQDFGWENSYADNGAMSGTSGQSKRLEGIEIFLDGTQYSGGIQYKTHVQDYGWESAWAKNGEMSGTQGQAKRLEGIAIELYGEVAEYYDIYYRVHAQDIGWLGWACNGAYAGTAGRSARLEGIQIVLVPKGGPAPDAGYGGIVSVTDVAFVEGF